MAGCSGNTVDHCCYVNGQPCAFLEQDTIPGRHWVCGLRRELGSWDAVHADPRYRQAVAPYFEPKQMSCGTYPEPGRTCPECGLHG